MDTRTKCNLQPSPFPLLSNAKEDLALPSSSELPSSFGNSNGFGNNNRGGMRFSGGPKTCHKCNEEGHVSRDCPTGGGGGRGSSACYKCNEEGHMARDCPTGGTGGGGGGGSTACFKCKEEGHFSRDCPSASNGGGGGSRTCHKCNEEGHIARDCPSGGGSGGGSGCRKKLVSAHFYISNQGCHSFKNGRKNNKGSKLCKLYRSINENFVNLALLYIFSEKCDFAGYENMSKKVTSNDPVPDKVETFADVGLRELLLENISRAGYTRPTPIQKTALPILMSGRDVMGCAQTGSGKTAAFLLPILQFVMENNCESHAFDETAHPTAVIVAPTRELGIQIHQEAKKFAIGSIVKCVLLYGGTSTLHQAKNLQNGCHVLVATPGRLLDFVEKGKVKFDALHFVVMDEADRMLDMGFRGDMEKMINHPTMPARGERKTLMFSATFSREVQELALRYLQNYVFIVVGMVGAANTDVHQTVIEVEGCKKRQTLVNHIQDILKMSEDEKILVFVERKKIADFLASFLCTNNKLRVTSIHGDRFQSQREEALATFRSGLYNILIATAVAARGLDIRGIGYVINYDLPKEIDEYVHRIGRTGRVGNLGRAISFFDDSSDGPIAKDLVKILSDPQDVPTHVMTPQKSAFTPVYHTATFQCYDIKKIVMSDGFTGGDVGGPAPAAADDEDWD
ncbi:unnamed protein product, partial [Meganyctiphanes norvegica]